VLPYTAIGYGFGVVKGGGVTLNATRAAVENGYGIPAFFIPPPLGRFLIDAEFRACLLPFIKTILFSFILSANIIIYKTA
jgi:hypothetical protein